MAAEQLNLNASAPATDYLPKEVRTTKYTI